MKFCRKLRLLEYYDSNEPLKPAQSVLRPPSNFIPDRKRNETLDNVCNHIENLADNLMNIEMKKVKNNMSTSLYESLNNLQNNSDIAILKFDKGGGFCILNSDFLNKIVLDFLDVNSPQSNYASFGRKDPSIECMKNLQSLIDKFQTELNSDEAKFITDFCYLI